MRNRERRATAFHEAAHAVVCVALGGVVRAVELEPRPGALCLHRSRIDRALTALAGNIAEQRACPNSPWNAAVDSRCAFDVAESLSDRPIAQLESFLYQAQAPLDRHWLQVEVLAAALVQRKRLSGRGLEVLFSMARAWESGPHLISASASWSGQCCR